MRFKVVIGSRKARPVCVACGGSVWSKGYRSVVLVDLPASVGLCGCGGGNGARTPTVRSGRSSNKDWSPPLLTSRGSVGDRRWVGGAVR